MDLADQWTGIEKGLDPRWSELRLVLTIDDAARRKRASALLAPAGAGSAGNAVAFRASRRGAGVGPEAIRRTLRRLDREGIRGALELVATEEAAPEPVVARASLAAQWDATLGALPADWSDLLCEVALTSTDHLDHAALLLAPVNPIRTADRPGFRFRCAHDFGYGASPGMVRRCFERADAAGMPGEVRMLRALSDTHPVGTQGPVWYVAGKAV